MNSKLFFKVKLNLDFLLQQRYVCPNLNPHVKYVKCIVLDLVWLKVKFESLIFFFLSLNSSNDNFMWKMYIFQWIKKKKLKLHYLQFSISHFYLYSCNSSQNNNKCLSVILKSQQAYMRNPISCWQWDNILSPNCNTQLYKYIHIPVQWIYILFYNNETLNL